MAASAQAYIDGFLRLGDGVQLHYRDYRGSKDRPPILCLHGLTRNARDFARFAERYSPAFRVIALDFRGRGASDWDPAPDRYSPLTYAGDVRQLLAHLGIGQTIFVGTSLGGLVTMTMAALAPHLIAGSILNDIGPELDQAGLDRIQGYVGNGEQFGSWDEAANALAVAQVAAFPGYSHRDWIEMARRNCREHAGSIIFDYDPAIANVFTAAGARPKVDLWPLFAVLAQKPLLVVRGELTDLLSRDTFARMQLSAPGAAFAEVPGVGHAPMLDEPAAASAIDAFLGRVAP